MRKVTDLHNVKSVAKSFLYLEIDKTAEFYPMFIQHPIFESAFQSVKIDGKCDIINITESEENLQMANKFFEKRINESDLLGVYMIIRKSYRLTFLKYIKSYLSMQDFCTLFADAWVMSENPNGDVNVPLSLAVKWFKQADKTMLMDAEEYKVYSELPDTLTVYRGVAVGRNPQGLSWTMDRDKAEWFAHRFDRNGTTGYLQSATIKKEDVLAYFNSRNEEEIVVSVKENVLVTEV